MSKGGINPTFQLSERVSEESTNTRAPYYTYVLVYILIQIHTTYIVARCLSACLSACLLPGVPEMSVRGSERSTGTRRWWHQHQHHQQLVWEQFNVLKQRRQRLHVRAAATRFLRRSPATLTSLVGARSDVPTATAAETSDAATVAAVTTAAATVVITAAPPSPHPSPLSHSGQQDSSSNNDKRRE